MAELITWNTCKLYFAQQYFSTQFEGIIIIEIAVIMFCLHYIIKNQWFKERLGQHRDPLLKMTLTAGIVLVFMFLAYFLFVFKPDMTQAIVSDMANKTFYGVESHV